MTVRLNNLLGDSSVDYGTLMAGALMVAAPTVLVYIGLARTSSAALPQDQSSDLVRRTPRTEGSSSHV